MKTWPLITRRSAEARLTDRDRESGASLVELAILTPFLLLLMFGIIEFANLYSQNLDVKHGAREAARLAADNFPDGPITGATRGTANRDVLVGEVCVRVDDSTGATVSITSDGNQEDSVSVEVRSPAQLVTGLLGWSALDNLTLSASAEARMLYDATWANTVGDQPCLP